MSKYSGILGIERAASPDYSISGEWEDLRFPMSGNGMDTTTGRLYTDYTNGLVIFATNARYSNEPAVMLVQLPHGWVQGTNIKPHLHWVQVQNNIPNWMIRWRRVLKNTAPAAWTNTKYATGAVYTYAAGNIHQITTFPDITMAAGTISDIVQIILYRDSANASGLFAGADPYTVNAATLEFDVHVKKECHGSADEYVKAI